MNKHSKHSGYEQLLNIRSSTEGVIWPQIVLGVNASLVAFLNHLEKTQWLPRKKIIEMQFRQMAVLAEHSAKNSPAFQGRLEKAGLKPADLATPQGLKRLPVLTRRDLQEYGERLFCKEIPKAHMPFGTSSSSGSTGQKVTVRRTSLSNFIWMGMSLRDHFWQERDFSLRYAAILPQIEEQKINPNWGQPVNLLFESGESLLIPSSKIDIQGQVRLLREFQPQYLITSPGNLAGLLDICEREKNPLTGIRRITTIYETLKDELRKKVKTRLGAEISDVYSSAEMGNMALQCPESGLYHVMAENIILEVLDENGNDCAEGQIGKVVATDLLNFAMPLIRYSLGDYAEMGGTCPCGRGLPVIRKFLGRERNLAIHPNGSKYWPAIGLIHYHEVADIRQFQFIQHDLETLEMRLVCDPRLTPEQEDKIRAMIHKGLGYAYKVNYTYFDGRIPPAASGKFEEFICKV